MENFFLARGPKIVDKKGVDALKLLIRKRVDAPQFGAFLGDGTQLLGCPITGT